MTFADFLRTFLVLPHSREVHTSLVQGTSLEQVAMQLQEAKEEANVSSGFNS